MTRFQVRQARTRESGFCIVCHRAQPPADRTVCIDCNEKAKKRVKLARRSARARVSRELEAKADDAAGNSIPLVAAQSYEAAFYAADDEDARARIAEKLGNVHFRSGEPLPAREWLQRALQHFESLADGEPGFARTSLRIARQLWIEGETPKARVVVDRALAVVSREADLQSFLHVHAYRAYQDALNDDIELAEATLTTLAPDLQAATTETLALCHRARAMAAALRCDAERCFLECDAGISANEAANDPYAVVAMMHEKAHRAHALGFPKVALAERKRSLHIARRFALGWAIRDHMMEYAYLLHQLGRSQRAADLMREVVDAAEATPELRICVASFGIPIALATGDRALLQATLLEDTIALSFATTEPYCILRVARAFAEWYYVCGRVADAEALLRRALRFVNYPEYAWDLLVFTLEHCRNAAIRATALDLALERGRASRSRTPAIEAMRQVCIALTHRDRVRAIAAAHDALPVLRTFGWATHVRTLERLLVKHGASPEERETARFAQPADALQTLTPRELQVSQLVARGLTNREIAVRLHITERTVESHMTSILSRLGLRSRWQIGPFEDRPA